MALAEANVTSSTDTAETSYARLSDEELDAFIKEFGTAARDNQRRFAGLLPEVLRRQHYLKRGCANVYVFAARYGGMRRDHVNEVLRLDRVFRRLPRLRSLLRQGVVGWSKLRTIARIATPETDVLWATHVTTLSKNTLEQFARDIRAGRSTASSAPVEVSAPPSDGAWDFLEDETNTPVEITKRPPRTTPLPVPPHVAERVLSFIEELSTREGRSMTLAAGLTRMVALARANLSGPKRIPAVIVHTNDVTGELTERTRTGTLDVSEHTLSEEYELQGVIDLESSKPQPIQFADWTPMKEDGKPRPRPPIPAPMKKWVMLKHGNRCAFPGCNRRATEIHHVTRFASHPCHEPDNLIPLCPAHHAMAHHGLVENESQSPDHWKVRLLRTVRTEDDAIRARIDDKKSRKRTESL